MTIRIKGGKEITDKLERIRTSVGGRKRDDFVPGTHISRIDGSLKGAEIKSLFHPSGLLIRDNRPVFAYIRDHTIFFSPDPSECNKVHFTVCSTLRQMDLKGRFLSRYRFTNRTDDKYYIDVKKHGEQQVPLYPCQNCLGMVDYKCFNSSGPHRYQIVKEFNAKEAMDLLRQYFDIFRRQTRNLRPDTTETTYPKNWEEVSRRFRKSKEFVCNRCGVKTNQDLTDAHHKDRDKPNINYDNLECLCKICHSEEHKHYKIDGNVRKEIEKYRREQGKCKFEHDLFQTTP